MDAGMGAGFEQALAAVVDHLWADDNIVALSVAGSFRQASELRAVDRAAPYPGSTAPTRK